MAPKDYDKLAPCIASIVQHSRTPIRNVYVVARQELEHLHLHQVAGKPVIWINEERYPFAVHDVTDALVRKGTTHPHGSWYYQQLLKLCVYSAIPDLLDHVLILDADFHFARGVPFLTERGEAILSPGYPFEWQLNTRDYPHKVTHVHARFAGRLVPGWAPRNPFSGMHHHMVLDRRILDALHAAVEQRRKQPFWKAFLDTVDVEKWNGASEYVLYFHHALQKHPERVVTRHLRTCDIIHDSEEPFDAPAAMGRLRETGRYDAVGCHAFLNLRQRLQTMDYLPAKLKQRLAASGAAAFLLVLEEGVLGVEEYLGSSELQTSL
ncbi:hypothetical protein JY651_28070 [Pyxidicoccus parkwayensis]|uniref:Uncharacterized protein n=1 Tax=Pyxidicoccus parkwayensis TaxID=2813578 RepID=A0ABX7NK10_9BACT|nr:hypothetical protein [Pyxidicoccus parkwaysis]QSQ19200.1 hypothetical protein JY651_28070 [Pyxidicoccus parkwaysis]